MSASATELESFTRRYHLPGEALEELCAIVARVLSSAGLEKAKGRSVVEAGEPSRGASPSEVTLGDDTLDESPWGAVEARDTVHDLLAETHLKSPTRHTIEAVASGRVALQEGAVLTLDSFDTLENDPVEADPAGPPLGDRYEDLGRLGSGGMGEVRRVFDRSLGRRLAMKVIKAELMDRPRALRRFVEEAQISAQLQHPGMIPVHEIGTLPGGRAYFTMREVKGVEFGEVIREVHDASSGDTWSVSPSGWSFRRLIQTLHRVCETVGHAHDRGVIHRDLKPQNIMVGSLGEVLVVDWGIAKVVMRGAEVPRGSSEEETRSSDDPLSTQPGTIKGTIAYMPPEQAGGRIDEIDTRTDVYALGAVLYEILSGRPPYGDQNFLGALTLLAQGPPPSVSTVSPWALPEGLVEVCERAMARDRAARFPDATAMAAALGAWIEGVQRRERALAIVEEAKVLRDEARALDARVQRLRDQGRALLEPLPTWAREEERHAGWRLEDEADHAEREALSKLMTSEQRLRHALTYVPDLSEAHAALASIYQEKLAQSEAARDARAARQTEAMLRHHASALPRRSELSQRFMRYLKGTGALTLITEPPGAEVILYRYQTRHRRLRPERVGRLGRTPLVDVAIERGSYLLELRLEGYESARYPVFIDRGERWSGVGPGGRSATPITLPLLGHLGPDDVHVPAGWFWAGGDPAALDALPRQRRWVDGFVMRRFSVTNREYIEFLNALVAGGREAEALSHAPRERTGAGGVEGALIHGYEGGRFFLRADADGDIWQPDWPAMMIKWHDARAYCRWRSEVDGEPWRLPRELEWEKAARGVDGRFYPWGDRLDASWCCKRHSLRGQSLPVAVDSFPVDISPYGVHGMAGNIRDWCAEIFEAGRVNTSESGAANARRVVRGGSWGDGPKGCRLARRTSCAATSCINVLGMRMVRSLPAKT